MERALFAPLSLLLLLLLLILLLLLFFCGKSAAVVLAATIGVIDNIEKELGVTECSLIADNENAIPTESVWLEHLCALAQSILTVAVAQHAQTYLFSP